MGSSAGNEGVIVNHGSVKAEQLGVGKCAHVSRVESTDKSVQIGRMEGSFSGVIGADNAIQHSFNTVRSSGANDELKAKLIELTSAVEKMCKDLPPEQAEAAARDLDDFTGEATSQKPRRAVLEALGSGLSATAKVVEKVGAPVAALVKAILALF